MAPFVTSEVVESQQTRLLVAIILPRCLAWFTVGMRFTARRFGKTEYGWDDWTILAAAIVLLPQMILDVLATNLGMGRHLEDALKSHTTFYHNFYKYIQASEVLYVVIVTCVKFSILHLYLRLFGVRKSFLWACWIQMGAVTIWALVTGSLLIFQCSPIWMAWELEHVGGKCLTFAGIFIGMNSIDVAICFILLATPLIPIWRLKLAPRKKLLVTIALLLGGCEIIFSMIRLVVVSRLRQEDVTWDMATFSIWSIVQESVGILCACIPVLAPLLPKRWLGLSDDRVSSNLGPGNVWTDSNMKLVPHSYEQDSKLASLDDTDGLYDNAMVGVHTGTSPVPYDIRQKPLPKTPNVNSWA